MDTNNNDSFFGEIIYAYTRAQAIADGMQESPIWISVARSIIG